jgi:hypothetical protein
LEEEMKLKQIGLAVVFVVLATLACDVPTPQPAAPPPTVTPYTPAQMDDPTAEPDTSVEDPTATPEPEPTETPEPEPTTEPQPTNTVEPVSTGPLDFEAPTWVHAWEQLPDGQVNVTLLVPIRGGAPPFTVRHELDSYQTSERDFLLTFPRAGCSGMAFSITVESSDGQSVTHDYWIGVEMQAWCNP